MPGKKNEKGTCEFCYDTFEKGPADILKCNGECGCVVHRYCAGVTKRHYESLGKGHKPFVCQWCSMMTSKAVVEQLLVASPPASYAAVRAASQVPSNQRRQQPRRNRQKPQHHGKPTADAMNSHSSTLTGTSSTTTMNSFEAAPQSTRVRVEGARKIWGTHSHATTKTVENAIERFCKVQGLRVRRKTTRNAYSRKTSWWFVVHADEAMLRDLEDKWDCLNTQTSRVFKPCFKPADSKDSASSSAESDAGQLVSNENPNLDAQ